MAEAVEVAGSPVELTRDLGVGEFTTVPDEITNWIEEQRSWRESCAFADQSYHMTDHYVKGPDALDFYADFAANNFDNSEPRKGQPARGGQPQREVHRRRDLVSPRRR